MNKKGIVAAGPAVIFVNVFLLIAAAFNIVATMGLVSGIVFNKKIKQLGWRNLLPRVIIFVLLTLIVIISTRLIAGPTHNPYMAMLWGALSFFIIICLFSLKNIKDNAKQAFMAIFAMTLLFVIISQAAVFVVIKWL